MYKDAHVRIGESFKGTGLSAERYLAEAERLGIGKAIVCPEKPESYRVEDGNSYVHHVCRENSNTLLGAMRVDPWRYHEMKCDLEAHLENQDFAAIYLNPWEENFRCNGENAGPVYELAKRFKAPVIIETGYPWVSHISQVADAANAYPEVNFLATNGGQIDLSASTFDDVRLVMDHCSNIYLGTSGVCGASWLANIAADHPDRVVLETNFPMMEPELEIFRISKGFMSEDLKERIMSFNLFNFLGI